MAIYISDTHLYMRVYVYIYIYIPKVVMVLHWGMGIMALDDGSVRRVLYESVAPIQQRHQSTLSIRWWNPWNFRVLHWKKEKIICKTNIVSKFWLPNHLFWGDLRGLGCSFLGHVYYGSHGFFRSLEPGTAGCHRSLLSGTTLLWKWRVIC